MPCKLKKRAYHLHTKYSDGKLDVPKLIDLLKLNDVTEFSITDHDTLVGNKLLKELDLTNLKYIPGIEITARIMDDVDFIHHDFPIHILGYDFDTEDTVLNETVDNIIDFPEANMKYYQAIADNLKDEIDIKLENITPRRKYFDDIDLIDEIMKIGHLNFEQAVKKYKETTDNIRYEALSASQCIKLIQDAGGKAVLAHPYKYTRMLRRTNLTEHELYRLIDELKNYTLDGVEVFYEEHSSDEIKKLYYYTINSNLLIFGGSDFHKPGDQLTCDKWDSYLRGDYDE